jgi:hypothetical protein
VIKNARTLEHGLQSNGSLIVVTKLTIIVILKKNGCAFNFNSSNKGEMYSWLALKFLP